MRLIFIDPGHGGRDPGNTRGGMREADIALALSQRIGHYIRLLSGRTVGTLFSRTVDEYVDINTRAMLARRARASLLVSVHTNASVNPLAQGAECLISPDGGYRQQSEKLGQAILRGLETCGLRDRGVRLAKPPWIRFRRLGVLDGVKWHMPAVLIEAGFASNRHDAELLRDKRSRETMAVQIAAACVQALGVEPRMDLV